MVRIIEATSIVTLLDAKDMLRREYETRQKREKKETAFMVNAGRGQGQRGKGHGGRLVTKKHGGSRGGIRSGQGEFHGKFFACNQKGHKQVDCSQKKAKSDDEFVFLVIGDAPGESAWLLGSGR